MEEKDGNINIREVQEYDYDTKRYHSYFIQVWLEFGIFGVISLCGIMYLVIRQKKNDTNRGIKFAILTLLFPFYAGF